MKEIFDSQRMGCLRSENAISVFVQIYLLLGANLNKSGQIDEVHPLSGMTKHGVALGENLTSPALIWKENSNPFVLHLSELFFPGSEWYRMKKRLQTQVFNSKVLSTFRQ